MAMGRRKPLLTYLNQTTFTKLIEQVGLRVGLLWHWQAYLRNTEKFAEKEPAVGRNRSPTWPAPDNPVQKYHGDVMMSWPEENYSAINDRAWSEIHLHGLYVRGIDNNNNKNWLGLLADEFDVPSRFYQWHWGTINPTPHSMTKTNDR